MENVRDSHGRQLMRLAGAVPREKARRPSAAIACCLSFRIQRRIPIARGDGDEIEAGEKTSKEREADDCSCGFAGSGRRRRENEKREGA